MKSNPNHIANEKMVIMKAGICQRTLPTNRLRLDQLAPYVFTYLITKISVQRVYVLLCTPALLGPLETVHNYACHAKVNKCPNTLYVFNSMVLTVFKLHIFTPLVTKMEHYHALCTFIVQTMILDVHQRRNKVI